MQSIPIVVSRLTQSGKKQIYTLREPLNNDQINKQFYKPPLEFQTMDQNKQSKVRIRRIQSSGSKRKFPKDFFSKQKLNRNATLKQNNTMKQIGLQTGCFGTLDQPDEQFKTNQLETPKFKEKNCASKLSTFYKNQTLKPNIKKLLSSKKEKLPKDQNKLQQQLICFENTFSGKQLKGFGWNCHQLDLRAILKPDKQNLPLKRIKVNKQFLTKKFSILKEKSNKLKNQTKS